MTEDEALSSQTFGNILTEMLLFLYNKCFGQGTFIPPLSPTRTLHTYLQTSALRQTKEWSDEIFYPGLMGDFQNFP